jgi:uncharacterized membrane protein YidH (DUF202 family)
MELIIQILMLFVFVNSVLKLSFWKWWQTVLFGLLAAAFVLATCHYATLQSKTQIADYLQNKTILQDTAVLITLESAICFSFCFTALRNLFGRTAKFWMKPLYGYPGLLIFPVLFSMQTQSIFSLPGIDFATISYVLAAVVCLLFSTLPYLFRYLFPETEMRLEVHFLVSLFVCILGLLTTVNGEVTYAATEQPVDWKAISVAIGIFVVLFAVGFGWNQIKWRLKQHFAERNK